MGGERPRRLVGGVWRTDGGRQAGMMRVLVATAVGIAAGIFGFAAGAGWTGSGLVAVLIAALVAVLVVPWISTRPIVALDEAACPRGLKVVSGLATLVALVQLARLAAFIVDPSQVAYSSVPASQWEVEHSCLSAYFISAQRSEEHTSELQSLAYLVCRLLLEKKKKKQ